MESINRSVIGILLEMGTNGSESERARERASEERERDMSRPSEHHNFVQLSSFVEIKTESYSSSYTAAFACQCPQDHYKCSDQF